MKAVKKAKVFETNTEASNKYMIAQAVKRCTSVAITPKKPYFAS